MNDSTSKPYHGVIVPMLTPFSANGDLDTPAVYRLLDYLIAGGVEGVLLLGTTGEAASMPVSMRRQLVYRATKHIARRIKVYAGIGDNCLRNSLEAAEVYWRLGVDVLVAHLPAYYEISEPEMYAYYQRLANLLPGPLMLYNIPSTTHLSIPVETVEALADEPNIIGIKDSENNLTRFRNLLERLSKRKDFACLWGSGSNIAQALFEGADGFVPTAGNLAPKLFHRLYEVSLLGDTDEAEVCQRKIQALVKVYGHGRRMGESYGLIKAALGAINICQPYLLPPLTTPTDEEQGYVRAGFLRWLEATI